jgi:hypothetical protein
MQMRQRNIVGIFLILGGLVLLTTCQMQFNKSNGDSLALQVVNKSVVGGSSITVTISQGAANIAQQTLPISGKTSIDFAFSMPPTGTYTVAAVLLNSSGVTINQASSELKIPMGNYPVVLTFPVLVTGITIVPGTPSDGSSVISGVWTPNSSPSTLQLTAVVSPSDAANQSVTWSLVLVSGGAGNVSVSNTGLISVHDVSGDFVANIIATANDGSGVTATFVVNGINFG